MILVDNISKYNSKYFITPFQTKYDPLNNRKNLYADILYAEMEVKFHDDKISFDVYLHVANGFYLPQGAIKANAYLPSQEILNIPMYNTNLKVDKNFNFGYPDASQIYHLSFFVNESDNDFLQQNPNSFFNIYFKFFLDTNVLQNLSFNIKDVDNLISDLENIFLKFKIDLTANNIIDSSNGKNQVFYLVKNLKIYSDRYSNYGTFYESSQVTNFNKLTFLFNELKDLKNPFYNLFFLKKDIDDEIKIIISKLQFFYYKFDNFIKTNILEINQTKQTKNKVIDGTLSQVELFLDNNQYQLGFGEKGFYFDETISGYYLVEIQVLLNGKWQNFLLKHSYSFKENERNFKIVLSNQNSEELQINDNDKYFQIQKD